MIAPPAPGHPPPPLVKLRTSACKAATHPTQTCWLAGALWAEYPAGHLNPRPRRIPPFFLAFNSPDTNMLGSPATPRSAVGMCAWPLKVAVGCIASKLGAAAGGVDRRERVHVGQHHMLGPGSAQPARAFDTRVAAMAAGAERMSTTHRPGPSSAQPAWAACRPQRSRR